MPAASMPTRYISPMLLSEASRSNQVNTNAAPTGSTVDAPYFRIKVTWGHL